MKCKVDLALHHMLVLSFPFFAHLPKVGGLDLLILDMRESGSGRSDFISLAIIPLLVTFRSEPLFAENLFYTG